MRRPAVIGLSLRKLTPAPPSQRNKNMPDKYNQIGVQCPNCHDARSSVMMTRSHSGRTFRRRKCKSCEGLFTTVEQYVTGRMKAAVEQETK